MKKRNIIGAAFGAVLSTHPPPADTAHAQGAIRAEERTPETITLSSGLTSLTEHARTKAFEMARMYIEWL
jgi:hypothetical protein